MTNRFRITVVIPYHNESKTIIKTLKQLVLQSYKKFDVILVNSQSSDNSSALIDNFIKKNNLKKKFQNINKRTFFPSSSKRNCCLGLLSQPRRTKPEEDSAFSTSIQTLKNGSLNSPLLIFETSKP